MTTPVDVLRLWFAAHERRDHNAAKELVSSDVDVVVPGARLVGFDALMRWYADRAAAEGPAFDYEVDDVLGGEHHAAAVLRLTSNGKQWRQVAVYRIANGKISSIWAVEEERRPGDP